MGGQTHSIPQDEENVKNEEIGTSGDLSGSAVSQSEAIGDAEEDDAVDAFDEEDEQDDEEVEDEDEDD